MLEDMVHSMWHHYLGKEPKSNKSEEVKMSTRKQVSELVFILFSLFLTVILIWLSIWSSCLDLLSDELYPGTDLTQILFYQPFVIPFYHSSRVETNDKTIVIILHSMCMCLIYAYCLCACTGTWICTDKCIHVEA